MKLTPLFQKLNLKDQPSILVINPPTSFEAELAALESIVIIRDPIQVEPFGFMLAFVTRQDETNLLVRSFVPKAQGDALLWFAYPKGSSKKYRCEINRDTGWGVLGEYGFEAVRQVAIDEDWSALRFRRVEYIQSLTRRVDRAMTPEAKTRLQKDE